MGTIIFQGDSVKGSIEEVFDIADKNLCCNTAYPVFKDEWKKYLSEQDIFADTHDISVYFHVPFCRQLCRFCEYTRFLAGNDDNESKYLVLLERQIRDFLSTHKIFSFQGCDIGGGTPTALSEKNLEKLLDIQLWMESEAADEKQYEKSIEFSFPTMSKEKCRMIGKAGFERASTGIQFSDRVLLKKNNRRNGSIARMKKTMDLLYDAGVKKINLDLMYGLPGQTDEEISATMRMIKILKPEHITIYETRFNRTMLEHSQINRELQFRQYSLLYQYITDLGYQGAFGANTFSRVGDLGVSSYLEKRMKYATPYKGFGISAQSMTDKGISYGNMKNEDMVHIQLPDRIFELYNYVLPSEEIAAKYVCIAMYHGKFILSTLKNILKRDPMDVFGDEIQYLESRNLILRNGDEVAVTASGFRYYGAIAALFWSDEQKRRLMR